MAVPSRVAYWSDTAVVEAEESVKVSVAWVVPALPSVIVTSPTVTVRDVPGN